MKLQVSHLYMHWQIGLWVCLTRVSILHLQGWFQLTNLTKLHLDCHSTENMFVSCKVFVINLLMDVLLNHIFFMFTSRKTKCNHFNLYLFVLFYFIYLFIFFLFLKGTNLLLWTPCCKDAISKPITCNSYDLIKQYTTINYELSLSKKINRYLYLRGFCFCISSDIGKLTCNVPSANKTLCLFVNLLGKHCLQSDKPYSPSNKSLKLHL